MSSATKKKPKIYRAATAVVSVNGKAIKPMDNYVADSQGDYRVDKSSVTCYGSRMEEKAYDATYTDDDGTERTIRIPRWVAKISDLALRVAIFVVWTFIRLWLRATQTKATVKHEARSIGFRHGVKALAFVVALFATILLLASQGHGASQCLSHPRQKVPYIASDCQGFDRCEGEARACHGRLMHVVNPLKVPAAVTVGCPADARLYETFIMEPGGSFEIDLGTGGLDLQPGDCEVALWHLLPKLKK